MNGRLWTKDQDEYLVKHFADGDTKQICKILKRSKSAVYGRAYMLGLKKSDEAKRKYGCYLTGKEGRAYRYPKGHVPANKGKKMPAHIYEKAKATMFKRGNIPQTHRPVGTISERSSHKRESTYLYVKIAEPNKWKMLHRLTWEKANGPIPRGMNLVFKDGDFRNCSLENLELITRAENMRRNTIHNRYPQKLKNAIMTLGALKRKIREHEEQY
jgi:hypothetical protein